MDGLGNQMGWKWSAIIVVPAHGRMALVNSLTNRTVFHKYVVVNSLKWRPAPAFGSGSPADSASNYYCHMGMRRLSYAPWHGRRNWKEQSGTLPNWARLW